MNRSQNADLTENALGTSRGELVPAKQSLLQWSTAAPADEADGRKPSHAAQRSSDAVAGGSSAANLADPVLRMLLYDVAAMPHVATCHVVPAAQRNTQIRFDRRGKRAGQGLGAALSGGGAGTMGVRLRSHRRNHVCDLHGRLLLDRQVRRGARAVVAVNRCNLSRDLPGACALFARSTHTLC